MLCSEVMSAPVIRMKPDDTLFFAATLMRQHNIGFLPVCDDHDHVIGVVTDRDLVLRGIAEKRAMDEETVATIMTREILSCQVDENVDVVVALMSRARKSRVVVVDARGELRGILSLADLGVRALPRQSAAALKDVARREVS